MMKRDCGSGDLIPVRFKVVYCQTASDREQEEEFGTLEEAKARLEKVVEKLTVVPFTNARLYAKDRQGYANCILSWYQKDGYCEDRTSEL